ncbi:MAG: hypothetical protein IIB90_03935 [Gemmatimonadetes bacterium]|nr:hypothetical protein [Gemmatimonadota bacterium]
MNLATMAKLQSTQRLLRELGSPDLAEEDAGAVGEYLALLFAAYRYWEAEEPTLSVDRDRLTRAIQDPPTQGLAAHHDACYLEFPERWFWATIGEGQPHEPLEGMFVVSTGPHTGITVVAILGLRPGREGFSQITVTGGADAVAAASGTMRDPPFAPVMDGGLAAGFKSVTSDGELLHLARLALESAAE